MANQQADAKVTVLNGKAYAERNGTRITLTEGADIYASDTIITDSASGVEVVFRDNAVIKLGPGSQVAVQDFVYDGESNPSFAVQLVTGVMTSLSGEVVKQNPAAFKISTPRATIGIRGTETYHSVQGDMETHAVVHISQGHIVMLNSSDGQAITLGSAMQAVTLNESGLPLTIRTFQPNEMDKLQNALSGMGKKAPVQDGQPEQEGPQTPNTGDEGGQESAAPQPVATSTVVQDEIRILVVAEAGTEAVVAVVQDVMQTVQDTTGIIIESPVITPIGTDVATLTPPTLTETLVADNPATPPADFAPPAAGEIPAPVPSTPEIPAPVPPTPEIPDPPVPPTPEIPDPPVPPTPEIPDPPVPPTPEDPDLDNFTLASLENNTLNAGDGDGTITVGVMQNATINAGAGDDSITITQNLGGNTINGGAGNDSLYIGNGSVSVSGVEHVYGNNTSITLGDADENVTLHGVSSVTGGSGNDTIIVADTAYLTNVAGGAGNDVITVQHTTSLTTPIVIDGGVGNDIITVNNSMGGNVTINGGGGSDVIDINGSAFSGAVNGDAGNDEININSTFFAGSVDGGAGNDVINVNSTVFSGSVNGGAGNDEIHISGSPFSDTVYGGGGNDVITIDVLQAKSDNSTLVDGEGPGVNSPNSETGTGIDHIIINHIAASDEGAFATVKGGHGDDLFTLGTWDDGTTLKLELSTGQGDMDTLVFGNGGVTERASGDTVGTRVDGGYAVDFVQDGNTLTVIFQGIANEQEYNSLKQNITGLL